MTRASRRQTGFTLIEVMVALVIGGMAVAGAAALLSSLRDRGQGVARAAAQADADANAERLLRGLVANLDPAPAPDSTPSFVGDGNSARFRTWCDTPAGWLGHCGVRMSLERRGDLASLLLEVDNPDPERMTLRTDLRGARFRYLIRIDDVLTWVDRWSTLVPPVAVALIVERDTLLFPVWGSE
jgi:prepilin-type N-terminal cleavage/methylation domain-containing protein